MKNNLFKTIIIIFIIFIWLLFLFEFGSDFIFLSNIKKTSGTIIDIVSQTEKGTCDYTLHPGGCSQNVYTVKYAIVNYKIEDKQYNSKLYLGSDGDTSPQYIDSKIGDNISFYYNNINKEEITYEKNSLYIGCIVTIIIFLTPFIIIIYTKIKKKK